MELNSRDTRAEVRDLARLNRVAIIAHDLRTPLSVIAVAARLVRASASNPTQIQRPAEAILRSAQQAERLIRDLLDASSLEQRLPTAPSWTTPAQLLDDARSSGELIVRHAHVDLQVSAPSIHLPCVWADRDRIAQVFWNLVGNAAKFAGPNGRISVRAVPRRHAIEFQVSDTGPGVSRSHRRLVFRRGWQGDPCDHRGSGLGLWICKQIIDAHHGRIWVTREPAGGTRVAFLLKSELAEGRREGQRREHVPVPSRSNGRYRIAAASCS
jgi:signal transduction histidine kinase